MNRSELINAVAENADLPRKDAENAVMAVLDAITGALQECEDVRILGFGTFTVRNRAARTGRNPMTKASYSVAARRVPVFKPGKALKDAVALKS